MEPGDRPKARASFELHAANAAARVVGPRSTLSALITRPAARVRESCSLAEAAEWMRSGSVSALVVGECAGIVTERDITRAVAAGCAPTDAVETLMTRHPLTVAATTSTLDAAGLMLNEQVRHLLVELGDGQVGIVSMRDLFAVLLQAVDPQIWLTSLRVAVETSSPRPWPS